MSKINWRARCFVVYYDLENSSQKIFYFYP